MAKITDFITDKTISSELFHVLRKNGLCLFEVREFLWDEYREGHLSYKEIVSLLFNLNCPETSYGWEEIERLLSSQSAEFYLSRMETNIRLLKKDFIKWDEIEEMVFWAKEAA